MLIRRSPRPVSRLVNRSAKGAARFAVDALESRQLLAAVQPTSYEQYMIELANRARANPAAEASRQEIDLNEGLAGGTLSVAARQPLTSHAYLTDAARYHAQWLRTHSKFQHAGENGSTPRQRMSDNWYQFTGESGSAENLALTLGSSLGDLTQRVEVLHRNLFVDSGVAGRGHRTTMLDDKFESVGMGVASGDYRYNDADWIAIIANQNFAYESGNPFLTGVVFNDERIRNDDFYTPGEGLNAYQIVATASDGRTYQTTTNVAGSYNLQVPAGTYTLKATGPGSVGIATYDNVVVGAQNVKRDYQLGQFGLPNAPADGFAALVNKVLTITGTSRDDQISIVTTASGSTYVVTMGNFNRMYAASAVDQIIVNAGAGNDFVLVAEPVRGSSVHGGLGNDTLFGTASADLVTGGSGADYVSTGYGNDTLRGDAGDDVLNAGANHDSVYGGDGDDRLSGNGGNDRIFGETGDDRLYGSAGSDHLDGGGNVDRLFGGTANDTLIGGSSNDRLYGEEDDDLLLGKSGKDYFDGGDGGDRVDDHELGEDVASADY